MKSIADAHVTITGAGAAGSHTILALLSVGVKKFTLVDFDRIEPRNIYRGAGLLSKKDVGRYKTEALARYIMDWDPASYYEVQTCNVDSRTLGRAFFSGTSAVICALDNRESVLRLASVLADTGIPLLRIATMDNNGSVEIIRNLPGSACLCCGKAAGREEERAGCGTLYLRQLEDKETPSLPLSTAIAANRMVMELTRLIESPEETHRDLRYYDTGTELLKFPLERDDDCPWHPKRAGLPDSRKRADVFNTTLGQYFADNPDCTELSPVAGFVRTGWCVRCGAPYPVNQSLLGLKPEHMRCPVCPSIGEPDQPYDIITRFTRHSEPELLDMTLYRLGI